jgi:transcriptional regulator with XRE-family HTH domain
MQRFGEKLHLLRTQHQMTVRDLAAALGYANNGYMSLLENGKRKPSLEVVMRVAQLFGVTPLCEQLARYNIAETLAHEEVHDANVIVGDDRYMFTDWSDSSVAHPFFTMLVTLRSTAYRLKLDEDGPEMRRLRDVYLEPWTVFDSRENLLAAFRIAYRLAMINRSLSYQRVLGPLPQQYKIENHAIPGWLQGFLEAETKACEQGPTL